MTWLVERRDRYFGYTAYVRLLGELNRGWLQGENNFIVDISRSQFFYPNGMCPLITTIRHLRSHGRKVHVELPSEPRMYRYWELAGWLAALNGDHAPPHREGTTYLPLTQYCDGEQLNGVVSTSLDIVAESGAFPAGVLTALEWTLNEIADNVLVHANAKDGGWIQLNRFPERAQVEFVIADSGRGIRASLSEAFSDIVDDEAALNRAIEKGVTRNRDIGQGNGLSGATRIASSAEGWLNLHSGTGQIQLSSNGAMHSNNVTNHQGTVVSVTLPTEHSIDLADALWGHIPVPAYETEYVSDQGIEFRLVGEAINFGNRDTGARLRNKLMNVMAQAPSEAVTIDFTGIEVMSASFADELVAKMVKELGPMRFFGRVRLVGMNGFVANTLDHVIADRLR